MAKRYSIRPDAFCQISVLQDGWTSYPLLFEFDRSTMDHATMRRKYRGYFLLWRNHLRAAIGAATALQAVSVIAWCAPPLFGQPPALSKEQLRHFFEMFFVGCVGAEIFRCRLEGAGVGVYYWGNAITGISHGVSPWNPWRCV